MGTTYLAKRCTDTLPALDIQALEREPGLLGGLLHALAWRTAHGRVALRWWVSNDHLGVALGEAHDPIVPEAVTWVTLVRTRCEVRASRRWFSCPGCGARVGKLYVDRVVACRTCLGLAYRSQRETGRVRARRELERLRARLGWRPLPATALESRPRGMHRRTFERLVERHGRLVAGAGQATPAMAEGMPSRSGAAGPGPAR